MAILRWLWVAMLAAVLLGAGGSFALADDDHEHERGHGRGHSDFEAPGRWHGVVSGTIVGVDYGSANIFIATPRGVVPVAVTPTTSIFRGPGFASFADLGRGARVIVDCSDIGGRLVAQIIRIR